MSPVTDALKSATSSPHDRAAFESMEWPWYFPDTDAYLRLLERSPFDSFAVERETEVRVYPSREVLTAWLEQPVLVPFVGHLRAQGHANLELGELIAGVIDRVAAATATADGGFAVRFKHLLVSATRL